MKYHLDTIPIWDSYKEAGQCPLCSLEYKSEKSYVDFFLSGSVMEPATRIEVNKTGFCSQHFQLLYKEKNRLGLALISHTHLVETTKKFEKLTKPLATSGNYGGLLSKFRSLFSGKVAGQNIPLTNLMNWLNAHDDSCVICNRLENLMNRYAYTVLHLWQKDSEFKKVLKQSKGFCLHHLALTIRIGQETLSSGILEKWLEEIIPIQLEAMKELDEDLLWFTQKFDYRNQDKPWGNSRDALPRTLQKLSGKYMEDPASNSAQKKD